MNVRWSPLEITLALLPVIGLMLLVAFLCYRDAAIAVDVKEILLVIVGFFIGESKTVYAYVFGSSKGSAMKDQALAQASLAKDEVIAKQVVAAAGVASENKTLSPDQMSVDANSVVVNEKKDPV